MTTSADPRLSQALARIQAALGAGRIEEAIDLADETLAQGVDGDPLLHRLRGVRRQQQGRLEEAVADFEIAVAAAPNDFAILNGLGLCLARAGRIEEGLARLNAAIGLKRDFARRRAHDERSL